jgi:hypothetical protein
LNNSAKRINNLADLETAVLVIVVAASFLLGLGIFIQAVIVGQSAMLQMTVGLLIMFASIAIPGYLSTQRKSN